MSADSNYKALLNILIIDDELSIQELISDILKAEGYSTRTAANDAEAFRAIAEKVPSAIILDIWLKNSDLDGLGILLHVKKKYPLLPIVVMSGHGTIETAVSAIKLGAFDYLEKPFTHDKLLIVLKRAYEASKLRRENSYLKTKVIDKNEIIGNSPAITKLRSEIDKLSLISSRALIEGPAGSGKELVARLTHKRSKKANGPFVLFNPASTDAGYIMHELFGEEGEGNGNGDQLIKKNSLIESAHNGTLYIDEVSDLPPIVQNRLLKFLQDQIIYKNGKPVKLDVRILSASALDMQAEVEQGRFRSDLFFRLNVVHIKVPPLAEHKEDIPILADYFMKQLAKFSGLKERTMSSETIASLQAYNFPGDIRQLRNVIEWTLIMNPATGSDSSVIRPDMLPSDILNNGVVISRPDTNLDMMSMPLREAREVFEGQYLSAQMSRFNNNISKTSAFVGMERSALHRKLKLLNIHSSCSKDRDYEDEDMYEERNNIMAENH